MNPILTLAGVNKRYGRVPVLQDVSIDIHAGEFVVLIGGSGSGKTTLLRLVSGLARADGGTIILRGSVVDEARKGRFVAAERRRLGMVFQDYALWPHFTCLQNVEAAARGSASQKRSRALDILGRVGMSAHAHVRPQHLSGGQQQRVGVARALAAESDLLLFDEALSSLDVDIRERLRMEIRTLARESGAAALFVSHDPLDAWRLADRVAVLEHGILTQASTPAELFAKPLTARVARFTGAAGGFSAPIEREGGQTGIRLGGWFVPAEESRVAPGGRGIVYIRPEGVSLAAEGAPASLQYSAFEAGKYRAYWRIAGIDAMLCSLEARLPPASACLSIASEHILIYPPDAESLAS